jgi:glyoxylase I family protein
MHLGHVAISVSNLVRSSRFYCRWFGLKKSATFRHPGLNIVLLKGSFTLELFQFDKRKPLPRYRKSLDSDLRTIGVKHFSVEVSQIEKLYAQFKKARVPLATVLRTFDSGSRYFFIKDPDGNLVEIMEAR